MKNKDIAERKMTEYIIKQPHENNCFTYYHTTSEIGFKMRNILLSDNELSEYISDAITHEHIHKTLDELFNLIVSRLFDGIEHLFRNHALHEKQIRNRNLINEHTIRHETYLSFIKRCGFSEFLYYYGITQEDILFALRRCNNKLYTPKKDLNQTKNITWKILKENQENK